MKQDSFEHLKGMHNYKLPSVLSFDLVITLQGENFVGIFYRRVHEIMSELIKNPNMNTSLGIKGIPPKNKNDQYCYLYCKKMDVLIKYPKGQIYSKETKTYYNRRSVSIEFLHINPISLYGVEEKSILTGASRIIYDKYSTVYDNYGSRSTQLYYIKKLFIYIFTDRISKYLINEEFKLNSKYVTVRNITIAYNIKVDSYHKFYVGFNRLIGEAMGYSTNDTDSTISVKFRDPFKTGNNSISVELHDVKESILTAKIRELKRKCGDSVASYVESSIYGSDSRTLIGQMLQIRVVFSTIQDVSDYCIITSDNASIFTSILSGSIDYVAVLQSCIHPIFGSDETSVVDKNSIVDISRINTDRIIKIDSESLSSYCKKLYNKKNEYTKKSVVYKQPIATLITA